MVFKTIDGREKNAKIHKYLIDWDAKSRSKVQFTTKKYLQKYLVKWHPKQYLLEGQSSGKYSCSSVQSIIKNVSNHKFHPHSFRHTYLTNIIEKVGVFPAMELAGHLCLNSTLHYNHIPREKLMNMYNPLDAVG